MTEASFEDGTEIESCLLRLLTGGARVGLIGEDASPTQVLEAMAILGGRAG
jgi:hypothetical protein